MVFTDTGSLAFATRAQLLPLTKNANVSLKSEFAYSLYSSDENTYANCTVPNCGTKSNCNAVASCVAWPASAVRSVSPACWLSVVVLSDSFGPSTPFASVVDCTLPVPRITPESNPTMPPPPLKVPAALLTPVNATFDTVTPLP